MSAESLDNARFARMYVKTAARAERRGAGEHRARLLAGLRGTVVEVGAGHGLNFAHYPPEVDRVIALEPNRTLRQSAEAAARDAPVAVEVREGVAERLPLEDASVDGAVASLVLCSVPDQAAALSELRRVLRPGGELRFYEHVIPTCQPKRALAVLADRSGVWPRIAGGCHPARDTTGAIAAAGFDITGCERFMFAPSVIEPAMPHVLGAARRR
jgi:ubiquinone/menaquinone biosynthesis C-methylase UbiE